MSAFVPHSAVTPRFTSVTNNATVLKRTTFVTPSSTKKVTIAFDAPRLSKKRVVTMIATGEPLEDWLYRVEKDLGKCTRAIFAACKEVAYKIRTASCDKMACFNDFGDEQLAIDVLADKVIFDNLSSSGVVATASSEENPSEVSLTPGGKFSVAFDPLDGSSIIDTNFSVGT